MKGKFPKLRTGNSSKTFHLQPMGKCYWSGRANSIRAGMVQAVGSWALRCWKARVSTWDMVLVVADIEKHGVGFGGAEFYLDGIFGCWREVFRSRSETW